MTRLKWLTLAGLVLSAVWATEAWAQSGGVGLSVEFFATAALTILLALAHGYTRGVDRRVGVVEGRVSLVEHEQKQQQQQLSLIREGIPMNYHNKAEVTRIRDEVARETADHRERVETALRDMADSMRHLNNRLDAIARRNATD